MAANSFSSPLALGVLPRSRAGRLAGMVALAVAGAAILWISAKVKVPFFPVPMTLQTLALFVIAATYGSRLAVATVGLYLLEGALGFPVFAGTPEKGVGVAYMFGPTGGYLAGYIVAAAVVGYAAERSWGRGLIGMAGAMLVGEMAILGLGFAWLATLFGLDKAFDFGVGPFILTDLVKVALAAALVSQLPKKQV